MSPLSTLMRGASFLIPHMRNNTEHLSLGVWLILLSTISFSSFILLELTELDSFLTDYNFSVGGHLSIHRFGVCVAGGGRGGVESVEEQITKRHGG